MADLNQTSAVPSPPEPAKGGVAARIRNYFLTGLVVAGPLAVTIWLIWTIITWADDFMRPLIPRHTGRKAICRGRSRVPGLSSRS